MTHGRVSPLACILALIGATVGAAAAEDPSASQAPFSGASDSLQEVTVTAQRLKLSWLQRNERVQQVSNFVYGIAALENDEALPRFTAPICPIELRLSHERGEFIINSLADIIRAAGAPLAHVGCHPNLFIFITKKPKELLHAMESRHFAVSFGNASPSEVDSFIATSGPVWVWHNVFRGPSGAAPLDHGRPADAQVLGGGISSPPTYYSPGAMGATRLPTGEWSFGPVYVVGDLDRLRANDLSLGQFADYVAMVSLAKIKSAPHLDGAQTILKLFDSPAESAPKAMSDWDKAFLKILSTKRYRFQRNAPSYRCEWCANSTPDHIGPRQVLTRCQMTARFPAMPMST